MSEIRVAQIIDNLGVGGAERLLLTAHDALAPLGVSFSVLCLSRPERTAVVDALSDREVQVHWFPTRSRHSLLDAERIRRVRSALRSGEFDLVQSHLQYANVVGARAPGAGLPQIATLHQTAHQAEGLAQQQKDRLESALLRARAAHVITVGEAVAREYRPRIGRVPLSVIPSPVGAYSVSTQARERARRELLGGSPGPLVLAVGRLDTRKGYDDLLDAFVDVRRAHAGAILAIAGQGALREHLTARIRALNLEGSVNLLGIRTDVRDLFAAADLFVLSSRSEGLPLALLEAMMAGLPIVATAVGDVPGVVGDDALVVPPGSPRALATAILELLNDPTRAAALGAAAARRATEQHGVDAWSEQTVELYREVLLRVRSPDQRRLVIAILTHGYKPRIGGIESQRAATTPRLNDHRMEPHVLTRAVAGAPASESVDGVDVRRLGVLPEGGRVVGQSRLLRSVVRPVNSLVWSTQAAWHLARLRPDVIHADEILSTARVALFAHRIAHSPVVVTAHASNSIGDVHRNQRTRSGRRLLASVKAHATIVASVSGEIDRELAEIGVTTAQRRLIPNGVDVEHFTPLCDPERDRQRLELGLDDKFVVVFTGRLDAVKRLDRVLAVWPSVLEANSSATFLIVGAGDEEAQLRSAAPDGVRFVGHVSDVRPWLRASDVFILPSDSEGLSCALLEAQAVGLPAVVTDVGSARDVVTSGTNGYVVAPGDEEGLRARLCLLATSPDLVRAMSSAARSVATERFSLDETVSQLADLYRWLVLARHS